MPAYYPQLTVVYVDALGFPHPIVNDDINVTNVTALSDEAPFTTDADGVIAEGSMDGDAGDIIELSHDTYPLTMRLVLQATQELAYTAVENDITTYVVENLYTDENVATTADIYIQDTAEATNEPKLLGSVKAGATGQFPFQTQISKTMRVFAVSKGEDFLRTENAFKAETGTDIVITNTIGQVSPLFDHYADATTTGTAQQNLYTDVIRAGTLSMDGDSVEGYYRGITGANANDKRLFPTIGGVIIQRIPTFNADAKAWNVELSIMREAVNTLRIGGELLIDGDTAQLDYLQLTTADIPGLDLDANDYELELDARTADAAGDITATMAKFMYVPASPAAGIYIDGGSYSGFVDIIDGGSSSSEYTDIIDGGTA